MQKTFTPNYLNNENLSRDISDDELLLWAKIAESMNLFPSNKSIKLILDYSKCTHLIGKGSKQFRINSN